MYPSSINWMDLLLIALLLTLGVDFITSGCMVLLNKKRSQNSKCCGIWIIKTFSDTQGWEKKSRLVKIMFSRNSLAIYAIIAGALNLLISVMLISEL